MKKLICILLACTTCATAGIAFSGCSAGKGPVAPGYVVEETEPDLKQGDFGFFIIDKNQLMATKYSGTEANIVIPEAHDNYEVSVIGSSMFLDTNIETVSMPDTVTDIKDYAFASCENLKSVTLSKSLKRIGSNAFFNCPNLESVELPDTIEDLGVYAFCATGLKSITIPESVTELKESVFFQCKNLTEVYLPASLTNIREGCFLECSEELTIKAPKGSYAETYATENNYKFEATE